MKKKLRLLKKHLTKKQISNHGLDKYKFKISDSAIKKIIRVTLVNQELENLIKILLNWCRWIAKSVVKKENYPQIVKPEKLKIFCGVSINPRVYENNHTAGVVTGLAWTQYGGEIFLLNLLFQVKKET